MESEPKSYIVIVEKNGVKIPGFRTGDMRAWFSVLLLLSVAEKSPDGSISSVVQWQ